MYTDYPTIYETTINQNLIYFIILGIILIIILLFTTISLGKIFKKANRSFISAFIPFYNIFVLLEIINLPKKYFILLLIPIANIFIYINLMITLAKFFHKSKLFGIGLAFLPFVFYPILAFSGSEYIGINIIAMEGKSIVGDIPVIVTDEEKNPVIHEEVDNSSKNINISIGGGVYQKSYTKDLLQVDQKQTIINKNNNIVDTNNIGNSINNDIIVSKQPDDVVETTTNSLKLDDVTPIQPITINEQKEVELSNDNINYTKPVLKQDEFTFCSKCGAKVKTDVSTCFLCGNPLK